MMRPITPRGSRTEKLTDVRPHRDRRALHLGDEAGEELHLRRRHHGVADHLGDRIAAVGGVDHRELLRMLAQHRRNALEHLGALERQHVAPVLECGLRGGDRRIDVGGAASATLPSDFARARIDRVGLAARQRRMPGAAIVAAAVLGQLAERP